MKKEKTSIKTFFKWVSKNAFCALCLTAILCFMPGPAVSDIGTLDWVNTYDSNPGSDVGQDVAIDSQFNVITVGNRATNGQDGYIVKYDYLGDEITSGWPVAYNSGVGDLNDYFFDTAIDKDDNVIVTGRMADSSVTSVMGVRKYNSAGVLQWADTQHMGEWSLGSGVCTDPDGNVYVAGTVFAGHTAGAYYNWAIWKYSPDGVLQTGFPIYYDHNSQTFNCRDNAKDIVVDSKGNIIVVGHVGISGTNNDNADLDWHVRKYKPNGDLIWSDTYSGSGGHNDVAEKVTVDANDNVIVSGYLNKGSDNGANVDYDWLVIKYAKKGDAGNGVRRWVRTFESAMNRAEVAYSVACDSKNNVYIGGYERDGSNNAMWRLEYLKAKNGNLIDSRTWDTVEGTINGVAVKGGMLMVAGYYVGTTDNDMRTQYIRKGLTLIAPNGGEMIPSGLQFYNSKWLEPPDTSDKTYKLKYRTSPTAKWKTIESDIADTEYEWEVPVPKKNLKKCAMKVFAYDNSDNLIGTDMSDKPFSIVVVQVSNPLDNDRYTAGENLDIAWDTNETKTPVEDVKLYYTLNGGKTWKKITTIQGSNPGIYSWVVPDVAKQKTKCKVKVVLKNANGKTVGVDVSDGTFEIDPL